MAPSSSPPSNPKRPAAATPHWRVFSRWCPKPHPPPLTPMPLLSLRSPLLAIEMPAMSSLTSCCLAHPRRRAGHRRRTLVSFTDTVQGKGKAPLEEGSPKGPGQPALSPRSRFHGLCPSQPVGPAPV
jgi:hypothetical protein